LVDAEGEQTVFQAVAHLGTASQKLIFGAQTHLHRLCK